MNEYLTAKTRDEAFLIASDIFPCDFEYDGFRSKRAGYPIYFTTAESVNTWISDLGNRLEVNYPDGSSKNIWIVEEEEEEKEQVEAKAKEEEEDRAEMTELMQIYDAHKIYVITLTNGAEVRIEKNVCFNGSIWPYKVNGQYFSNGKHAAEYLKKTVNEKLTGKRILPKRHPVPEICGVNGAACRHKGKCNSALCSSCPIAEKFWAEKEGLEVVYAIE